MESRLAKTEAALSKSEREARAAKKAKAEAKARAVKEAKAEAKRKAAAERVAAAKRQAAAAAAKKEAQRRSAIKKQFVAPRKTYRAPVQSVSRGKWRFVCRLHRASLLRSGRQELEALRISTAWL